MKVLPSLSHELALLEDPSFHVQSSFSSRRLLGPPWSNFSCALDTVLMALIQVNAGRTRADQVFVEELYSKRPPEFRSSLICMRMLIRGIDGTSVAERGQLKDYIRKCLVAANPKLFHEELSMDITDVAKALFQLIPQASYTTATRVSYDQGESWSYALTSKRVPRLQKHHDFQVLVPDLSVSAVIAEPFKVRYILPVTENVMTVSSDVEPDTPSQLANANVVMRVTVIADRVPYVAMITSGAVARPKEEMARTWSFAYTYRDGQLRRATYSLLGYAMLTGGTNVDLDGKNQYGGHYTLYWKDGDDVIFYDGLQNDGIARKKINTRIDDFRGLRASRTSRMQLAFYSLVSDGPDSTHTQQE